MIMINICSYETIMIFKEGDDFDSLREPLPIPWHVESEFAAPDDEFTYGKEILLT